MGKYVDELVVVERGVARGMTDMADFLAEFNLKTSDFLPFQYINENGWLVNRTNTSGGGGSWREMKENGWLIPSGLESSRVELLRGEFDLYGYYPKGTLARVARETAEMDYRNQVAPVANKICQQLYQRNASDAQMKALIVKRVFSEVEIRKVLIDIPAEPATEFEKFFRLNKALGFSSQQILASYAKIQQSKEKYGDILTLSSGQRIHPSDPHYSIYAGLLGIKP